MRTVSIGNQDFETIQTKGYFYIDKTAFIQEWWERGDSVTLLTRPRRFGKTLNMSMLEKFFSVKYAGRTDLFGHLSIGKWSEYHKLQGTFPVIFISFANVKEHTFDGARQGICRVIEEQYNKCRYLLEGDLLNQNEKSFYCGILPQMSDSTAAAALRSLSDFLERYYGKKTIILLDEYDTPMQEAYRNGYWNQLLNFIRGLFNATFKTNPYLERAVLTGITRVSRESVFSDLNNLKVVTTTSVEYEDCFGFLEEEVFASLEEFGLSDEKGEVKKWYDGFTFGNRTDIYNPWSVINYLDTRKIGPYWANSSSNQLIGKLLREANREIKEAFEQLLSGGHLTVPIDEQIVYDQLDTDESAVWSLLLAGGYLKVVSCYGYEKGSCEIKEPDYELALTNLEVRLMFGSMVRGWFQENRPDYNDFIKALLLGDVGAMNDYINGISQSVFSYFDTGKRSSAAQPERFYHGFVLGLMVELRGRYVLTSNRESGFGRYDVILEPQQPGDDAIILEFKVFQPKKEKDLTQTAQAALKQIEEMNYAAGLVAKGIDEKRIRKYGFGFRGKEVWIQEELSGNAGL